jgi:hypothetical protein
MYNMLTLVRSLYSVCQTRASFTVHPVSTSLIKLPAQYVSELYYWSCEYLIFLHDVLIHLQLLMLDAARNFSQQIAPLPALSYLHLSLARGHVSGAILSHLLGVRSTIRAIIIVLTSKFEVSCSSLWLPDMHTF